MRDMGVTYLRTGLSWADWFRPDAERWFDRQMRALEEFRVTATFCFTPEHEGQWAHYTAVPKHPERFAEFCAAMIRRYAPGRADALGTRARGGTLAPCWPRSPQRRPIEEPVALVVAHPDDETIARRRQPAPDAAACCWST